MPFRRAQTPAGQNYEPNPETEPEYTETVKLPSELTGGSEHRRHVMRSRGLYGATGRRSGR